MVHRPGKTRYIENGAGESKRRSIRPWGRRTGSRGALEPPRWARISRRDDNEYKYNDDNPSQHVVGRKRGARRTSTRMPCGRTRPPACVCCAIDALVCPPRFIIRVGLNFFFGDNFGGVLGGYCDSPARVPPQLWWGLKLCPILPPPPPGCHLGHFWPRGAPPNSP